MVNPEVEKTCSKGEEVTGMHSNLEAKMDSNSHFFSWCFHWKGSWIFHHHSLIGLLFAQCQLCILAVTKASGGTGCSSCPLPNVGHLLYLSLCVYLSYNFNNRLSSSPINGISICLRYSNTTFTPGIQEGGHQSQHANTFGNSTVTTLYFLVASVPASPCRWILQASLSLCS
jgi:hypothetical protein